MHQTVTTVLKCQEAGAKSRQRFNGTDLQSVLQHMGSRDKSRPKSLADDIARELAACWAPPRGLPGRKDRAAAEYWSEIRTMLEARLWRPAVQSVGQLVELLLKGKLQALGVGQNFDRLTLGQLVRRLEKEAGEVAARGADITPSTPHMAHMPAPNRSLLDAATILRNWASHHREWSRAADGLVAAQALVLLVSVSENLFPEPRRPTRTLPEAAPTHNDWRVLSPIRLVQAIEDGGLDFASVEPLELAQQIAKGGMPSTITKFERLLVKRSLGTEHLAVALVENFAEVVRRAAASAVHGKPKSSSSRLGDLLLVLGRIGLRAHSDVLSVLLPTDLPFLLELMQNRASAHVAFYVRQCARANPRALEHNTRDIEQVARAFWDRFGSGQERLVNAANILRAMPIRCARGILRLAPERKLLDWIERSTNLDGTNFLFCFTSQVVAQESCLHRLRARVLSKVIDGLPGVPLSKLSWIPRRLHNERMSQAAQQPLLSYLLQRCEAGVRAQKAWEDVRRILWDVYLFCKPLRPRVVQIATRSLQQGHELPIWERMALQGLLEVADAAPVVESAENGNDEPCSELRAIPERTRDRWQYFLVVASLASRPSIPEDSSLLPIVEHTSKQLRATQSNGYDASERLMGLVGQQLERLQQLEFFRDAANAVAQNDSELQWA